MFTLIRIKKLKELKKENEELLVFNRFIKSLALDNLDLKIKVEKENAELKKVIAAQSVLLDAFSQKLIRKHKKGKTR